MKAPSALALAWVVVWGCSKTDPKPLGGDCSSGDDCQSTMCLTMSEAGRQAQKCTAKCQTDRDCAGTRYICQRALAPALCVPPGAGKPIGTECAKNDDCDHGMCLTVIGEQNYCTKTCVEDGDCGTGFACKADFVQSRDKPKFCARR